MKAGSLQWMTISVLCESPRDRHLQEKCASKCVRSIVLSAFIYFLARMDLKNFRFSITDFRFCPHHTNQNSKIQNLKSLAGVAQSGGGASLRNLDSVGSNPSAGTK